MATGHNKRLRQWIIKALRECPYPLSSRELCDKIIVSRSGTRIEPDGRVRAGYLPNISLMRVAMVAKTMNGKELVKVPNRTMGQGILWKLKGKDYTNKGKVEEHEREEE